MESVRTIQAQPSSVLARPLAVGFPIDGDPAPTGKASEGEGAK
jgi:hypothetical protein